MLNKKEEKTKKLRLEKTKLELDQDDHVVRFAVRFRKLLHLFSKAYFRSKNLKYYILGTP